MSSFLTGLGATEHEVGGELKLVSVPTCRRAARSLGGEALNVKQEHLQSTAARGETGLEKDWLP